jgi:Protein of unknown function (DUF2892)
MFSQNVGSLDKLLRLIIGAGLISLVFLGPKTAFGWIGLIPILTALAGQCPAYSLLKWRTNKSPESI